MTSQQLTPEQRAAHRDPAAAPVLQTALPSFLLTSMAAYVADPTNAAATLTYTVGTLIAVAVAQGGLTEQAARAAVMQSLQGGASNAAA